MRRRSFLRLATVSVVGLAGCTATALPGAHETDGDLPSRDCPDLLDADLTVCPQLDGGPLTVERSRETVSSDRSSLRLSVTNRDEVPYRFNPYGWSVYRQIDGHWARVTADADTEPRRELAPGDRFAWQLSTAEPTLDVADQRIFLSLAPGRYAVAIPFHGPDRVAAVGPFDVVD